MRVGFIGLGDQGAPMARRIVEAGYPTTLWARRPASLAAFGKLPVSIAASPAELGARSDLVCICVLDDRGVEEVLSGRDGVLAGLSPGGLVAVHTTTHPDTCRRLAAQAATSRVQLLDAPVSGGATAASDGNLLVMVGGDTAAFARCRPVFETFGNPVLHLGQVGTGQTAKVVNNLAFTAQLALATETYDTARRAGISLEAMAQVLEHGSARSAAAAVVAGAGFSAGALAPRAGALLGKDVRLAAGLPGVRTDAESALWAAAQQALLAMEVENRDRDGPDTTRP